MAHITMLIQKLKGGGAERGRANRNGPMLNTRGPH